MTTILDDVIRLQSLAIQGKMIHVEDLTRLRIKVEEEYGV